MQTDLTRGSVPGNLLRFSLPYLLSSFLQTFYGLADLYITGQFNGAASISAVSIGSQVMHMLTVIIVGLAMGSTVTISQSVGEKNTARTGRAIGNTISLFLFVSLLFTAGLLLGCGGIVRLIQVPAEAVPQTRIYLMICFAGVPFITAYNIISCIFRGIGDSKSPLYFIAVSCVLNIMLDYLFIGGFSMGAAGAALGTVLSQTASVLFSLLFIRWKGLGIRFSLRDLLPDRSCLGQILAIGMPIAFQDGFIQVSFLVITVIANRRGVIIAASVGIVEKIISFLFLVPSAMLSSISAIAAQNVGARQHRRAADTLRYGVTICILFGLAVTVLFQFVSGSFLSLFTSDTEVVRMGAQYLRAYVFDCIFAGIHFSFSGYFCAYGRSGISFFHNLASILLCRIPGAYLASIYYPDTLYPMGLAAPAGSLLSALICLAVYLYLRRQPQNP